MLPGRVASPKTLQSPSSPLSPWPAPVTLPSPALPPGSEQVPPPPPPPATTSRLSVGVSPALLGSSRTSEAPPPPPPPLPVLPPPLKPPLKPIVPTEPAQPTSTYTVLVPGGS